MHPHSSPRRISSLVGALIALVAALGCSRDLSTLEPAQFPTEARVFSDNYTGVTFAAFGGSKVDAVALDPETRYRGSASIKVTVPAPGDVSGGDAGGA